MARYIVDGSIHLGTDKKYFGDPEAGVITYFPDDSGATQEQIAEFVRTGFLRTEAEALPASALQAQIDALQAQQAALEAQLAEAQAAAAPEAAAPTTKSSKGSKSAASDSTDTPPEA